MTTQNLFGYNLLNSDLDIGSVLSPKVGIVDFLPILQEQVERLRRCVGMKFEFQKVLLQEEFLGALIQVIFSITTQEFLNINLEEEITKKIQLLGLDNENFNPYRSIGMGFEFKRLFYEVINPFIQALESDDDVTQENKNKLQKQLQIIERYVGMPEGDGEDYHFMVAIYSLLKTVIEVKQTTTVSGEISGWTLTNPGSGIMVDSQDEESDTATGVQFFITLTNPTASNYAPARVIANIVDGEITNITSFIYAGNGFTAGGTAQVLINDEAPGQSSAVQDQPGIITIDSIVDIQTPLP